MAVVCGLPESVNTTCSNACGFASYVRTAAPHPTRWVALFVRAGISTWVGAGRRFVVRGITITSCARRFRTLVDMIRAGRALASPGCPGRATREILPRRGSVPRTRREGRFVSPHHTRRALGARKAHSRKKFREFSSQCSFCPPLKTAECNIRPAERRGGRVVEGAGLENR